MKPVLKSFEVAPRRETMQTLIQFLKSLPMHAMYPKRQENITPSTRRSTKPAAATGNIAADNAEPTPKLYLEIIKGPRRLLRRSLLVDAGRIGQLLTVSKFQ
jgi:hypothetical protein